MAVVRIDIPKGMQDGQSSVSPESPNVNSAADQPMSMGKKIAIGYGLLAVRTSYQTIAQEVGASGNEELATQMQNFASGVATATTLYVTGGLAAIPMGIQELSASITRSRQLSRENRNIEFQRAQLGRRVTFNQGRAYE